MRQNYNRLTTTAGSEEGKEGNGKKEREEAEIVPQYVLKVLIDAPASDLCLYICYAVVL